MAFAWILNSIQYLKLLRKKPKKFYSPLLKIHYISHLLILNIKAFGPQKLNLNIFDCCGASEPEASERSSNLIRAVGSKKQIFSVAWDCGRAQMCAQLPQIGLS